MLLLHDDNSIQNGTTETVAASTHCVLLFVAVTFMAKRCKMLELKTKRDRNKQTVSYAMRALNVSVIAPNSHTHTHFTASLAVKFCTACYLLFHSIRAYLMYSIENMQTDVV